MITQGLLPNSEGSVWGGRCWDAWDDRRSRCGRHGRRMMRWKRLERVVLKVVQGWMNRQRGPPPGPQMACDGFVVP